MYYLMKIGAILLLLAFTVQKAKSQECILDKVYFTDQSRLILSIQSDVPQCKEWIFGPIDQLKSIQISFVDSYVNCNKEDNVLIFNEDKTKILFDYCQQSKLGNIGNFFIKHDIRYAFVRGRVNLGGIIVLMANVVIENPVSPSMSTTTFKTSTSSTISSSSNVNLFSCGVPYFEQNDGSLRIVGGSEANPHSWPWQAKVSDGNYLCGATLISSDWIITAAHCVSENDKNDNLIKFHPQNLQIVLGEHDLTNNEGTEQIIKGSELYIYDSYTGKKNDFYHGDIALVKLEKSAVINEYVKTICLPETSQTFATVGSTAYVTGWGQKAGGDSPTSNILNQVGIEIVDNSSPGCIGMDNTKICAGDIKSNQDSCSGDSGGPLQLKVNDKYILAGIVSYGEEDCNLNGVYTRVTSYRDWIKRITGI